jgi:hypothetical protein
MCHNAAGSKGLCECVTASSESCFKAMAGVMAQHAVWHGSAAQVPQQVTQPTAQSAQQQLWLMLQQLPDTHHGVARACRPLA